MRKNVGALVLTVLLVMVLLAGCGGKEEQANGWKDRGEFVVGLDDSFPPMGFRDEKGEIVGFDIDLAKEAAKRMGVNVVFKPVDWDGIVMSLNNKDIDVIWNGLTITEKRKEEINFTEPYLKNRQIIVVQAGSKIIGKEDLAGKIIGLQMGSSSEEALNGDQKTLSSLKEVRKYGNNTEALLDLKAGRTEAVVIDEVVGRYYVSKKPGVYQVLEDYFAEEAYGVGYRKEDEAFGKELDRVLKEIKADGTADEISKKWFGEAMVVK